MVATCWERVEPELKAKGWGVQQLADAIGVSYQAIKKVKDGGAFNTENNIAAAAALNLNPTWLATGKGPKAPDVGSPNLPPVAALATEPAAAYTITDPKVVSISSRKVTRADIRDALLVIDAAIKPLTPKDAEDVGRLFEMFATRSRAPHLLLSIEELLSGEMPGEQQAMTP